MLPETSKEQSTKVAEDLRRLVSTDPFEFEGDSIAVTISVGVGVTISEIAPDAFIRMADENLYKAKRTGRNRVVS